MDLTLARRRVDEAPVGRLGTITSQGRPHLVPCCFALVDDVAYTAVDDKPKSSRALRRIDNIEGHSAFCLLVDHYEDDWSNLWWVRLDGDGRVVESAAETELARRALVDKYSQYRNVALAGPVIALEIKAWKTWP